MHLAVENLVQSILSVLYCSLGRAIGSGVVSCHGSVIDSMELQQMLYLLVADAAVLRRAQDIGYAVERWS